MSFQKSPHSSLVIILGMLIGTVIGGTAWGYLFTKELPQMIAEADLIVIGEVKKNTEIPGKTKVDRAVLSHEITILKVLKGSKDTPKTITLVSSAAKKRVEDMPVFPAPKGRMVLFLSKAGTSWGIINFAQGLWPLDSTGQPLGMGQGTSIADLEKAITGK